MVLASNYTDKNLSRTVYLIMRCMTATSSAYLSDYCLSNFVLTFINHNFIISKASHNWPGSFAMPNFEAFMGLCWELANTAGSLLLHCVHDMERLESEEYSYSFIACFIS